MYKHDARMMLPGPGDLQDYIEDDLGERLSQENYEKIIDWLAGQMADEDEGDNADEK